MAVFALAVGALFGLGLGWMVARRNHLSHTRTLQADLVAVTAQLAESREHCATGKAQVQASEDRIGRLLRAAVLREGQVTEFERERARHDQEFRQVSLLAARVPTLEERLVQAEVRASYQEELVRRVAQLEPLVDELDLRDQFIETLHRQLVYRDERILGLQCGVSVVSATPVVSGAPPSSGLAAADPDAEADAVRASVSPVTDGLSGGGNNPSGSFIARKALSQALAGLGVDSFGDVACLDEVDKPEPSRNEQELNLLTPETTR